MTTTTNQPTQPAWLDERDEGGEYPCSNCGTPGWDCLTEMNVSEVDQRCCGECGINDMHSRPAAAHAAVRS
jgi:hypothetical protein